MILCLDFFAKVYGAILLHKNIFLLLDCKQLQILFYYCAFN